jgi:hypothetical protein
MIFLFCLEVGDSGNEGLLVYLICVAGTLRPALVRTLVRFYRAFDSLRGRERERGSDSNCF